jgi:hypothetical protein
LISLATLAYQKGNKAVHNTVKNNSLIKSAPQSSGSEGWCYFENGDLKPCLDI